MESRARPALMAAMHRGPRGQNMGAVLGKIVGLIPTVCRQAADTVPLWSEKTLESLNNPPHVSDCLTDCLAGWLAGWLDD